jgi:hypothetical protein
MNVKWEKITRGGVVILSAAILSHSMGTEEHDWIIDMGKYHIHQENYASPVFTRATEVSTASAQGATTMTTTV